VGTSLFIVEKEKTMKRILFTLFVLIFSAPYIMAQNGTRFLHQPDVSADSIVFVFGEDLWTVPVKGGTAKHLTMHPGSESQPKFSPDGRFIAFTGQYDGNSDVYIIPAKGGEPRRLTFHPANDQVQDWSPDGTQVMFSSNRSSYSRFNQFFAVNVVGGFPKGLPMPMASLGSYSPDGKQLAYTPLNNSFTYWKRYRGGRTTPIWLIDLQNYSHTEIPHENASDTYPAWVGDKVYFLSDRSEVMNLYEYDTKNRRVKELVNHDVSDIKYLSGGPEKLVYATEGYLYVYDAGKGSSSQININVPFDSINIRPYYKNVATEIQSAHISPTGVRAVFEAHGEILTAPARKGDIRNHTRTPGVRERLGVWSPDGHYIAYFSDSGGEYALYIVDQLSNDPPKKITFEEPTWYYNPVWSPDSKKIAFSDKRQDLYYLDVESANIIKVASNVSSRDCAWSPDSRWIAYNPSLSHNRFRVISIYSLENRTQHQITDAMSDSYNPVFSRDGKYLYFLVSTDVGQVKGRLDMSVNDNTITWDIYITLLRSDLASPFAPESDEERSGNETRGQESQEESEPVRIDFENIDQRILSLPLPSSGYSHLQISERDKLFFREGRQTGRNFGGGSKLRTFDLKERKAEDFMEQVSEYIISADGKKMLYRSGRNWAIVPTSGKPKAGDGRLDLSGMEVKIDPPAEWRQMFYEAWRFNRDFFFDPNMHGLDWDAVGKQYAAYLPDIVHRSDLNYVIGEMIGEICAGHSRVRGGAQGAAESRYEPVPVGLLGADYEIDNGRYRIKKVYSGLNWNPDLRAPLTQPGVNVKSGDYIIKVNGKDLHHPTNIYSLFEKTVDKQVSLHVNSAPSEEGCRIVTVVPVNSERNLRNRDWIEGNKKKVEEMTNGRIGYIYLPNTGTGGQSYFIRYFFAQLDKEGLIIDERFNGGGQTADYILDILDRSLMSYWAPRDGPDYTTPFHAVFGPKVMVTNEYAFSGGDWMPYYFQKREIGPLVGKRTGGGLIGGAGTPGLMDGGSVSAPSFAIFSPDGKWIVENVGAQPDYEVEMTPAEVIKGHDPQLEKAVEVVLEDLKTHPFKRTPRPEYPIRTRKKK
jgi:tricorn protease